MKARPVPTILGGAMLSALLALGGAVLGAAPLANRLSQQAAEVIGDRPVVASFATVQGSPSRHPLLTARGDVAEDLRGAVARDVAAIDGVGGVHWTDGTMLADAGGSPPEMLQCQGDVAAILKARSIRFEEASSSLASDGADLLDEVATALRPCTGARIAITGHTDASGDEAANRALSRDRAEAVKRALVERGIGSASLQTRGFGSSQPMPGLDPADPANRRIEFTVVAKLQVRPTPIDTPGPR